MKLTSILAASLIVGSTAFTSQGNSKTSTTQLHETKADLQALAAELNPLVKYWDPLGIAGQSLWEKDTEFTIGWFRHAEIKHGRVAMAAFVGYCVQSNFVLPWTHWSGEVAGTADLSPPEQWDAMPMEAKLQIILFVGFLEHFSEITTNKPHYTKGGKPGEFPSFASEGYAVPHPTLDLYDPLKWNANKSEEQKARGLAVEINNGRLAMIGIFGMLAESKIPGAVPVLKDVIKPYSGEVMSPFETTPLWEGLLAMPTYP